MSSSRTPRVRAVAGQACGAILPDLRNRPLRSTMDPPTSVPIVVSLILLLGAALTAITHGMHSVHWEVPLVAVMLAVLYVVTDLFPVEISPGTLGAVGEVFVLVAYLVLPTPGILVFAGLSLILVFLYCPGSWFRSLTWSVNSLVVQLGALAGVLTFATAVPPGWQHPVLAVMAVFIGSRLMDAAVNYTIAWWAGTALRTVKATSWARLVKQGMLSESTLVLWVGLEIPIALIGFYLYLSAPWSLALLVAPFGVLWFAVRKVAQLREAHQRMQQDPHTGLANRGHFFELGAQEIEAARRYGHSLWLIMGDIDNFKRVNDTLGHVVGDEVLRRTACALLRSTTGHRVVPARYGGEEFALLAPAMDGQAVRALANAIRLEVSDALVEDFGTTISLGIAEMRPGDELLSVVDRADKALYAAKIAGKDRVYAWVSEDRCAEVEDIARRDSQAA